MKKLKILLFAALLVLLLGGCRVRTVPVELEAPAPPAEDPLAAQEQTVPGQPEPPEEPEESEIEPEKPAEETPSPDAPAQPDETSERREFAPDASGELAPEAETPIFVPTETPAESAAPAPAAGEGSGENVETLDAELTVTETVPAEEADQLGVDESGEVAESVQTYYLTLLDSRLGDLFECKRLYVYWETAEDHRTVFKTSPEHQLILLAGAYDVSAKLLEENLTVDDGWITRKNPDAVVKVVDGALDAAAAQSLCAELSARPDWAATPAVRSGRMLVLSGELLQSASGRTAAAVYLAKLLYPEQMQDVDADEALRALSEESAGRAPSGLYAYTI